jgi:diguanylate cyclase
MLIPICIVVAIAIACVIVAVVSATQRADEVTLATERELFSRALHSYSDRIRREVESVASTESVHHKIRVDFDAEWIKANVGQRLHSYFGHHFVFVTDSSSQLLHATLGNRSVDPARFNTARSDLDLALSQLRGASTEGPGSELAGHNQRTGARGISNLQSFLGRPAIVAAIAITRLDGAAPDAGGQAPAIIGIKLIDGEVLTEIASQLQLRNLREVDSGSLPPNDHAFPLLNHQGQQVAIFAWTPTRPGATISGNVIPSLVIAILSFALLAALILIYMRGTAETIASGETRLRHLAMHDYLCALPNRVSFSERLEATITNVRNGGAPAAVLCIDLDHFKDVNDTLGHPVGDELIRAVAQRLIQASRETDLVARIGGDEFAIITGGDVDHSVLLSCATRLITAICAPYMISNQNIIIGASIGIAVITERTTGAADIMRHADMALYRAKNEGRNRACIYDTAMDSDLINRKLIENDLRLAIERNDLRVAYQPIVNNSGEIIIGVEGLCRWTHPTRGEIPPSEFIPIAEHSGLITKLGEWMLRRACIDGKAWPDIIVAVNVSPLQFRRTDFVDEVERIVNETGFDPTRLELEVTESTLLGNVESAEIAMFRLKALGVRLALDDFGTGYSSLLYLRRFPFDKLKIDRSFVHSIERAADAAAIVHAVVSLGRGLGMKVTAEGVETADQHLFLRAAGIHSMQGYRFGRPGPAADITKRLAEPGAFRIADDAPSLAMSA